MPTYVKSFLNKKNASGSSTSDVMKEMTSGTFVGAAIGASLGLFIAYKREKSYLLYSFIGLMAGGIITRVFIAPPSISSKSTTS
jgi:gas vesicle protein